MGHPAVLVFAHVDLCCAAQEMMDWAAMLYMAVAHTNGGSTEMYEAELTRLQLQVGQARS